MTALCISPGNVGFTERSSADGVRISGLSSPSTEISTISSSYERYEYTYEYYIYCQKINLLRGKLLCHDIRSSYAFENFHFVTFYKKWTFLLSHQKLNCQWFSISISHRVFNIMKRIIFSASIPVHLLKPRQGLVSHQWQLLLGKLLWQLCLEHSHAPCHMDKLLALLSEKRNV